MTNTGPGNGATMIIPGSQKSNIRHPELDGAAMPNALTSVYGVKAACEVQLDPGDALVFVGAIMHGSVAGTNSGQRQVVVYRYGPSWGSFATTTGRVMN